MSAIDAALSTLQDHPETWPRWKHEHPYRKVVVERFPYVVFFTVAVAAITAAAIAHSRRRPGYWMG